MKRAVIIKGNPKYINSSLARDFYRDLERLLKGRGFRVSSDPGLDYTCPVRSDVYIMHSRGCSRIRCLEKYEQDESRAILLGSQMKGAINHPVDEAWAIAKPDDTSWEDYGDPPKEHFILTSEMKNEINKRLDLIGSPSTENYNDSKWLHW